MSSWWESVISVAGPLLVAIPAAAKWITHQMRKRDDERDEKVREIVHEVLAAHMHEEENTVARMERQQARLDRRVRKSVEQQTIIIDRLDALDKRLSA